MPDKMHFVATIPPQPLSKDWTCNSNGVSNSSEQFQYYCDAVAELIRSDVHMLMAGRADLTARLIMAHLAHEYGLRPPEADPNE